MTPTPQEHPSSSMRVIAISQPGGAEVLQLSERIIPQPKPAEVLIKVEAAGVNRPDIMQRMGLYPPPSGASDIPGLEIAGIVVELGEGVQNLQRGDSVCALVAGGGYAEYCTAPAPLCLPIPHGLNMSEAASLPETFFTVWSNVFDRAGLQPGERLLVHGGSSGIGVSAIQLARCFGAEVFVTAGNAEKCAACIDLGAHAAINYRNENFVDRIKILTDNRGVNVILDMIGGDYLQRNIACLAPEGRLVQIALQQGSKTNIDLLPIMLKRLTLTGSTLRPRSVAEKSRIAEKLREQVWPLLSSGQVRPVIHRCYPLGEAVAAHRLMESSQHIGKIVLVTTRPDHFS